MSLLKYLQDMSNVKTEKFKLELDKFPELIPNKVKMAYYVTAYTRRITIDQPSHNWAQGIKWHTTSQCIHAT